MVIEQQSSFSDTSPLQDSVSDRGHRQSGGGGDGITTKWQHATYVQGGPSARVLTQVMLTSVQSQDDLGRHRTDANVT